MRISDWSSDVCSSDLVRRCRREGRAAHRGAQPVTHPTARIEQAKREVEQARRQLASTTGALQYRLKPGNLVSSAWEGVREKSGEMANGALRTVKDRPVATSGVLAALVIFLAREPLWQIGSAHV